MNPDLRKDAEGPFPEAARLGVAIDWMALDGTAQEDLGIDVPPALVRAVPRRQGEYRAGRACVRRAICVLGADAADGSDMSGCAWPRIGPDRVPVWPEGLVGSLSHSPALVICAVAPADRIAGVGIEIERPLVPEEAAEFAPQVMTTEELDCAAASGIDEAGFTLLFSAKEALCKAMHPALGRRVGFGEARADVLTDDTVRLSLASGLAADLCGLDAVNVRVRRWQGHLASFCVLVRTEHGPRDGLARSV